jgi:hypothetical protein
MADLNEKLAILAGYKQLALNSTPYIPSKLWNAPDGQQGVFCPDYTHDLTACFRDIKPLLIERGVLSIGFNCDGKLSCTLTRLMIPMLFTATAETEALAFCEAAIKFLSE